jgi:hypothetical protein
MPNHSDAISVPQRFHFNVGNGKDIVVDRNGVLLADIGDAIAQALIVLRRNVRPLTAWYPGRKNLEIIDARRRASSTRADPLNAQQEASGCRLFRNARRSMGNVLGLSLAFR